MSFIQCPRCGAFAPWGASQCPNCAAAFVAPPTPLPEAQLSGWGSLQRRPPQRLWFLWAAIGAILAGVLVAAALRPRSAGTAVPARVFATVSRRPAAPVMQQPITNSPPVVTQSGVSRATNLSEPYSAPEAPSSQGIFKVRIQLEQQPLVAIGNATDYNLRFRLKGADGTVWTESVPARTKKNIPVVQGEYYASVDTPDDVTVGSTSGTVNVKNFHRYEADFGLVSATDAPPTFYIGD